MELHDLPPARDPKGGSPKSPSPIPVREYEVETRNGSRFHPLSGVIIAALSGALIGALGMWWTALQLKDTAIQERGVSRREMEDYVDRHSPYIQDKKGIDEHQASQDQQIGEIKAQYQILTGRIEKLEGNNH